MIPKRLLLLLFAVGALALSPAPAPGEEKPLKTRIWLSKTVSWEADIVGRYKDRIDVRKKGETAQVNIPPDRIMRIDYPISVDRNLLLNLYLAEKYGEIRKALAKELDPKLRFADIPDNLWWMHTLRLKCLFWDEQYKELSGIAEKFITRKEEEVRNPARLWHTLGLIGQESIEEAVEMFETVSPPKTRRGYAAQYNYTASLIHDASGRTQDAREANANVIAFNAKDYEWMPAALFLSAQRYAADGSADIARQVTAEIRTAYPSTRWAAKAEALGKTLE